MLRFLALGLTSVLILTAAQTDNEALAHQGVEAERSGDFAGAIPAFQQLVRNGADTAELRSNLGIAYYQLHEFSKALREFRVALTKNRDSTTANLFSGLTLLKLERPKEALPYLASAHRAQPNAPETLLALAGAEIASNDISRAHGSYEEATRLDAGNAEAWYGLGITDRILAERELREAGSKSRVLLDASERAISKAMQLDPGSVRAHMILGESFRIADRYDLAVQEYKAAAEQQPNAGPAWAGLATAYSAFGDDLNALKAGVRALELDPRDAATTALLAGTYLRLGEYAQAEQYATSALRMRPDFSNAQVLLAKIYIAQQQPEKALSELLSAAKEDTDGATYYSLGTTLKKLGRIPEAAAAMRKYQSLHKQSAPGSLLNPIQ